MTEAHSYRQILRSSSIIGGASVINILVGLLRAKAVALILGPAGVGLFGLFTNIVATASTLSGLGFGNVGTRQIAEASANDDPVRVAAARRALFWGTMALAILGGAVFWLLRGVIARHILGDAHLAGENAFSFGLLQERAHHQALASEDRANRAWRRARRKASWLPKS